MSDVQLNDGRSIPQIGMGVYKLDQSVGLRTLLSAIDMGYRHFDTAATYGNEDVVGRAIASSGLARDDFFLTTKLPSAHQGTGSVDTSLAQSLERLNTDYVDLYIIHWPAPELGLYVESWERLLAMNDSGLARSVGVSNFEATHLDAIISATGRAPAVNQIELHPGFQQRALVRANSKRGIVTAAWSPLARGVALNERDVLAIAQAHGKSPAQIILRWHLEQGRVIIPKSNSIDRLRDNLAIGDFALQPSEVAAIDRCERGQRTGPNPATHHA